MATLEETLRSLGLSAARGIPQLATGFVDLAALPFTATGMLKPEQAVGSTAYLTSKGLLPPEQQGLLNQTTELLSGAINPATATKAALAKGGLLMAAPIAYHGSPYIFDKFDISKLGSGEGAQAYSRGMYFAEAPDVARGYQMALSQKAGQETTINGKPIVDIYNQIYNKANKLPVKQAQVEYDKAAMLEKMMLDTPPQQLLQYAKDIGSDPKVIQWLEKDIVPKTKVPGAFYKVDIPDKAANTFLDWDKPLSQQNDFVRKAVLSNPDVMDYIKKAEEQRVRLNAASPIRLEKIPSASKPFNESSMLGKDVLTAINQRSGLGKDGFAEQQLQKLGIQGVKYLDQGSRSIGQGTNNFVVYDPNIVKILERNNQPMQGLLK